MSSDPRRTIRFVVDRLAGRREAFALMAAWHDAQEKSVLDIAENSSLRGRGLEAVKYFALADAHKLSARRARALAARDDDPAGPLPVRVRVMPCHGDGSLSDASHYALRVFTGPEHGGANLGTLVVRAEELAALRAGWPGAAFVDLEPTPPPESPDAPD